MPTNIKIIEADRPGADEEEVYWVNMIYRGLGEIRGGSFLRGEFVECDSCAAKPGSPTLCAGCLANRYLFGLRTRNG